MNSPQSCALCRALARPVERLDVYIQTLSAFLGPHCRCLFSEHGVFQAHPHVAPGCQGFTWQQGPVWPVAVLPWPATGEAADGQP